MKEKAKGYGFPGAVFLVTLLDALFWVALRVNYSGISKFLGADTNPSFLIMNLPVIYGPASQMCWMQPGPSISAITYSV